MRLQKPINFIAFLRQNVLSDGTDGPQKCPLFFFWRCIKQHTNRTLYIYEKMSWHICVGFKNLEKLGSGPNNFQNHYATPTFLKNHSKSRLSERKYRGFPFKMNPDPFSREFKYNFCSRSEQFILYVNLKAI